MRQPVENALRAVFDRTTIGLDDNPTRFQEVAKRFKRRRRRRAAGAVSAVAAVIALTAGSAIAFGGGPEQSSPIGEPDTVDCPPVATSDPAPTSSTQDGTLVPEGAVAVRACGEIEEVDLHRGVDRVVGGLNALSLPKSVQMCTDIGGQKYNVVLAYPDGERVTVLIDTGGCGTAQVRDQVRFGSSQLTPLLYELAEQQRWAEAPTTPPPPSCPAPATLTRPTGDELTPPRHDAFGWISDQSVPYPAVAVAVCRYSSTDPASATLVASDVVTDGAERARELVNGQGPEIPFWDCEPPAGAWDVLVFADAAGGMYEVRLGRGECRLFYSATNLSDQPEPELKRWLDDTLGSPPVE